MVERRIELDRRYHRKKKVRTLKKKLGTASGDVREKILYKIKRLSPGWTEASLDQKPAEKGSSPKTEKKPSKPAASRAKK